MKTKELLFKQGDIVQRKDTHRDSWWSIHETDQNWEILHDVFDVPDATVSIICVDGSDRCNVYAHSLELVNSK